MYEENENKIEWGPILKKIGMLLAVVLVIFLIVTGISKCTKKDDVQPENPVNISLEEQLDELERATLEYLTSENLPTELNASKTIRLKILVNKGIVTGITDGENNRCDVNESYSEVTRLENNYAVKMSLTCGKNKASRVIYVGCFERCNGSVCKGEELEALGICGGTTNPVDTNNQTPNQSTDNKPSTTTKPSTSKPNTNKPSTDTNKPSTPNTNTPSQPNPSTPTTTKGTLYQYKKCSVRSICHQGSPNANGDCEVFNQITVYGQVLTVGGSSSSTTQVPAEKSIVPATKTSKPVTTSTTVYLKNSSEAKNTSTVTYKFIGIMSNGTYKYTKTTTTYKTVYTCNGKETSSSTCTVYKCNGKVTNSSTCTVSNGSSSTSKSCADKSFTYNSSTGKCEKVQGQTTIVGKVIQNEVCDYTWSYSPTLAGWTRTGATK